MICYNYVSNCSVTSINSYRLFSVTNVNCHNLLAVANSSLQTLQTAFKKMYLKICVLYSLHSLLSFTAVIHRPDCSPVYFKMAESEMPAPDIHPTLAEDVEQSAPPPSYEEVMGQFVTSVTQSQELPVLSYIDIMPRLMDPGNMKEKMPPTFETFRFCSCLVGRVGPEQLISKWPVYFGCCRLCVEKFTYIGSNNINDNNEHISRVPFPVKHAQLCWTGANTKLQNTCI